MEILPLIHLKNRKILDNKDGSELSYDELLTQVDTEKEIYILDIDGIENDKPNLCFYQRITEQRKIWADSGPRVLGDVVDAIMAGAKTITIRKNLWPKIDVSSIKEIAESRVFVAIDLKNQELFNTNISMLQDVDGVVLFLDKNQIDRDFTAREILKTMCSKYNTYVTETYGGDLSYWKKLGVHGVLMHIDHIKEMRKNGF
jgi:uncharacterized protein related to proFAR isomerase